VFKPHPFDEIAQRLAMNLPGAIGERYVLLREDIARELRLAWNARGAADIAILERAASRPDSPERRLPVLRRALRRLDQ
jgi:hypothetical protein